MRIRKSQSRPLGFLIAASALLGGISLVLSIAPAQAQNQSQTPSQTPSQTIFEEQGSLQPMQHEHTFSGTKGQSVTISMISAEFDTFLALIDPDGQELAINDDYARSLNSTIVVTLPKDGTYKIVARSFSGQGGNYTVTVNPATEYDQAYSRGVNAYIEGDVGEAIEALSEAIEIDPDQPVTYLDRGDLYYEQGEIDAVIADYQKAADLYEEAGDMTTAQMLREQITYIQEGPDEPQETESESEN
ncbi:MAG: tetratricopeptide repeat protein [Cyanobacteria bacterium CRU_2_1]|nr:tetratricopeptide repeat protein [Cyanobacteria bacterium RU_5_0]NJR61053.1 tetratricopeptide repeat protein [Cyanobacteria bacterium CRU_2_1]